MSEVTETRLYAVDTFCVGISRVMYVWRFDICAPIELEWLSVVIFGVSVRKCLVAGCLGG